MDRQVPDLTWDDGTGDLVVGPLRANTDRVGVITFLYDSRLVMSGSGDKKNRSNLGHGCT